jgi:hypothetical protein
MILQLLVACVRCSLAQAGMIGGELPPREPPRRGRREVLCLQGKQGLPEGGGLHGKRAAVQGKMDHENRPPHDERDPHENTCGAEPGSSTRVQLLRLLHDVPVFAPKPTIPHLTPSLHQFINHPVSTARTPDAGKETGHHEDQQNIHDIFPKWTPMSIDSLLKQYSHIQRLATSKLSPTTCSRAKMCTSLSKMCREFLVFSLIGNCIGEPEIISL